MTKIKTLYWNLIIGFVLILILEIIGQVISNYKLGQFRIFHSTRIRKSPFFEPHPYLVGRLKRDTTIVKKKKKFHFTKEGLRYTGYKKGHNRKNVVCIGGSTTFGTGVSDEDSWPFKLQEHLGEGYNVFNFGVPGYSTAEGIIQLALQVEEYNPYIIIIFEGWNDIRNYHTPGLGSDYFAHGISQAGNLGLKTYDYSLYDKFHDKSGIAYLVYSIQKKIGIEKNRNKKSNSLIANKKSDPFVDSLFIRNIITMESLCRRLEAIPLFIPQIMNIDYYSKNRPQDKWTPTIQNKSMPEFIDSLNNLIPTRISSESCYLAEMKDLGWNAGDFLDGAHFSKEGNEKFASELSRIISKKVDRKER